jgi:hypothetical protein
LIKKIVVFESHDKPNETQNMGLNWQGRLKNEILGIIREMAQQRRE